ncbi:hypothetical protein QJS10_CPB21g01164 [Acorus calamus]|uniref:Uncharacterized protein n=1 Tax=Acorus calamus TaxID=4465 RepID=A0AAV9C6N4_ACOCL|nr:hypothetical protein QJS10_CPB21g01164 [Acorus calamus]
MAGDEEFGAVDDRVGESHPKQRSMEFESQYREASELQSSQTAFMAETPSQCGGGCAWKKRTSQEKVSEGRGGGSSGGGRGGCGRADEPPHLPLPFPSLSTSSVGMRDDPGIGEWFDSNPSGSARGT